MAARTVKAKKRPNFPEILGFEYFPEGKLLNQRVDFEGPVGIAYERCIGYTKPEHSHDRVTVTFPRGSSRSFIKVFPESKTFNLTDSVAHLMAKDHAHEQGSVSSVYDTFALFVTLEHFEAHLQTLGAQKADLQAFLKTTQSFRKSAVLRELVDRYFICRVLDQTTASMELAHLESMILTELYSLSLKSSKKPAVERARADLIDPKASPETALLRAIEFIESHLFEKLDVSALVRSSRTSQATLFRLFKRDLKMSPLEYVRNRRLDEAQNLLKGGQYQVSDVALLVGYEDLSSFSKAFKARFGASPSRSLPKLTRVKERHGQSR